jgi:hypothetical protein
LRNYDQIRELLFHPHQLSFSLRELGHDAGAAPSAAQTFCAAGVLLDIPSTDEHTQDVVPEQKSLRCTKNLRQHPSE